MKLLIKDPCGDGFLQQEGTKDGAAAHVALLTDSNLSDLQLDSLTGSLATS